MAGKGGEVVVLADELGWSWAAALRDCRRRATVGLRYAYVLDDGRWRSAARRVRRAAHERIGRPSCRSASRPRLERRWRSRSTRTALGAGAAADFVRQQRSSHGRRASGAAGYATRETFRAIAPGPIAFLAASPSGGDDCIDRARRAWGASASGDRSRGRSGVGGVRRGRSGFLVLRARRRRLEHGPGHPPERAGRLAHGAVCSTGCLPLRGVIAAGTYVASAATSTIRRWSFRSRVHRARNAADPGHHADDRVRRARPGSRPAVIDARPRSRRSRLGPDDTLRPHLASRMMFPWASAQ